MRQIRLLIACTIALLLCALHLPAAAEIRIIKANGEAVPETAATLTFNPKNNTWTVELLELHSPNAETVYEIRGNAGEIIDTIDINIEGPPAGSPVIVRVLGEAPGGLHSVYNIVQKGTAETILHKVNVSQDIGMVQVEAIGDLIAGRNVYGPIIATTTDNTVRGISNIRAGGNILGDMTAENGRILLISAPTGNIGAPGAPVNIRAKHSVYHIEAQSVYANVNTRVNGGTGGIFALDVQRFVGSLVAEQLIYNPWLAMQGLIYITHEFAGSITLGKSFSTAGQYIQVPPNGLNGQIIINADNASGGAWSAPVRVGPNGHPNQVVLNSSSYPHTPSMLGGGSVGLVPFKLHHQACVPPNGSLLERAPNAPPSQVQLRHYGPVVWTGASTLPVTIDRRVAGTTGTFSPAPSIDFAAAVALTNNNTLTITAAANRPGFAAGYEYRIRALAQNLKCDVPSQPPVQWIGDYFFTVIEVEGSACAGDISSDGSVGVPDLLAVINAWGQSAASNPACDINADGTIGVPDLLGVINLWGPCP